MPKYRVHIPVSIDLVVEVDAENEDEALEKGFLADWSLNPEGAEILACEAHDDLLRGDACSLVLYSAYAEEIDAP